MSTPVGGRAVLRRCGAATGPAATLIWETPEAPYLDQNVADLIFAEKYSLPPGGRLRSGGARRSARQFAAEMKLTPFRSRPY